METAIITEKPNTQFSRFSRLNLEKIPDYVALYKIGDSAITESFQDIYRMREYYIFGLTRGTALTHRKDNIAARFNQLASEIEEDCMMVSFSTLISLHPSYQEIIGMSSQAVPLLIKRLDTTPNFWFKALEAIAGYNPIPKQDRGYVNKEIAHWKNWAREKKYA